MLSSVSSASPQHAVLPPPDVTPARGLSSEEQLLMLLVYSQVKQMNGAETSINLSYEQLEQLRQEAAEALRQAQEAQESSGFWGAISDFLGSDVAAIATAVAAAAAVVATGGAAAAVVAAVAVAISLAAQHAEELGIPPEVALVAAVVAAVASLCVGNAGSLFKVCDTVKTIAGQVNVIATATGGAATIGAGTTGAVKGHYDGAAQHCRADARSADGRAELTNADIQDAIQRIAEAMDQKLKAVDWTSTELARDNQTSSAVLLTVGGES